MENASTTKKVVQLLEQQLAYSNQQNQELSAKLDQALSQIHHLTKLVYGSKSEKSKYQAPDGQGSLFEDDPSFSDSEQTEEKSTETISYTVVRKVNKKKRNDSFRDDVETEEIHHHPESIKCDCCQNQMTAAGTTIAREEAKFIPAKMMRIQYIEHAYECKHCKKDTSQRRKSNVGKRH